MKKIISVLILSFFFSLIAEANGLSDIQNHKNKKAIEFLHSEGIISGYSNSIFAPNKEINRAELVKILVEAVVGAPSEYNYRNCFRDVDDQWYAKYACYAKEQGWINGYKDGSFRGTRKVSKSESIKMMVEAFGLDIHASSKQHYPDVSPHEWYGNYIKTAFDENILEEKEGTFFNPHQKRTRAEISENIYRIVNKEFIADQTTSQTENANLSANKNPKYSKADINYNCSNRSISINRYADYIIVGRELYEDLLPRFIKEKERRHTVAYYNLEDIICEYEEGDIAKRIRDFLIEHKNISDAEYLLIVGSPIPESELKNKKQYSLDYEWEVPIRYVDGLHNEYLPGSDTIPTDQYYASLTGSWDTNNNGIYGEYLEGGKEEFSLSPDLYVGRVPVRNREGLKSWIKKTLEWTPKSKPKHSEFISERCIRGKGNGIYAYNLIKEIHPIKLRQCITDNGGHISHFSNIDDADFVSSYSHGFYNGIVKSTDYHGEQGPKGNQLGYELNSTSPAFNKPPIIFVHGCQVGGMDQHDLSLGQELIQNHGGATAMIASSRSHMDITFNVWNEVFFNKSYEIGRAIYNYKHNEYKINSISDNELKNFMMFNLFGDPSLELVKPDIELSTNKKVIDFEGENQKQIKFSIKNNTGSRVRGYIKMDFHSPYRISSELIIEPYSTTEYSTALFNDMSAVIENEISISKPYLKKFIFVPSDSSISSTGTRLKYIYNQYGISCDRVVDDGEKWRISLGISENMKGKKLKYIIKYRPAYIDDRYPNGVKSVEVYNKIKSFNESKPIVIANRANDIHSSSDKELHETINFGLLSIHIFSPSGETEYVQCNVARGKFSKID